MNARNAFGKHRHLGVVALAIVLPLACGTGPREQASRPPTALTIPPASTSMATASRPAPTSSVPVASSSSSPVPTPTLSPYATPDPGPGKFSCADEICTAGAEVCAPREACAADWPAPACVRVADLKARSFDEMDPNATCKDSCYSWYDHKSCDGAGDCKRGEVCCYDADRILGPCSGDDGMLDVWECKPAGTGKTPCGTAEVCSEKDRTCRRPGSTCVIDLTTGRGACHMPRRARPKCGAAPCADGQICVQQGWQGPRSCVLPSARPENTFVIECDLGRECAPDEACYGYGGNHRCDVSAVSWAGDDLAHCEDASDCVGFCKTPSEAACHDEQGSKFCECRPRCRTDRDCKKEDFCLGLSLNRFGGASMHMDAYCDKKSGQCECTNPRP